MKKIKSFILAFFMLFSLAFSVKAEEYLNEDTIRLVVEGLSDISQQDLNFMPGKMKHQFIIIIWGQYLLKE